jgi:hypothetical protein
MSKLETETSAFKTIEAGLVLEPGNGSDSGDYPEHAYTNLRYIRRVNAVGKEPKKIIRNMSRQLVTTRDEKGRFVKREMLTNAGEFRATDHRGQEHGAEFEIGKYQKPRIVANSNQRYSPETGQPLHNEKILSGQETVFEIEIPKGKEARKKLIDSIISDNENHESAILYYYRELDQNNYEQYRDGSFNYSDFVNCNIEELKDISQRGSGSKSSPYYTDKEGQLRYKKTDTLVTSTSNKAAYE